MNATMVERTERRRCKSAAVPVAEPAAEPAGLIDLDEALREFPSGFHYSVADGPSKHRCVGLLAKLLAETLVAGSSATLKLERATATLRAQVLRGSREHLLRSIEAALRAQKFLSDNSREIEAIGDVAEAAGARMRAAKEEFVKAESRLQTAHAEIQRLDRFARDVEAALAAAEPSDPAVRSALEHLAKITA